MTKQAKFTYYPFGKSLEKQTKIIEYHGTKEIDPLNVLKTGDWKLTIKKEIPENQQKIEESKTKIEIIKEIEKMINTEDLTFKTNKNIYNFQQFDTTRSFAKVTFNNKVTLNHWWRSSQFFSAEILNLNKQINK